MCEADKIIDGKLVCGMETMSEELKPCPFCGSTNEVYGEDSSLVTCENHFDNGQFIAIKKEDWQNAWAHKRIEEMEKKIRTFEN